MPSKRSRVHPPCKTKYRVTNSAEYNQALVDRGNLTLWISPCAIAKWNPKPHPPQARNRSVKRIAKVGRQRWKTETGYHKQGKLENAFFRYKSMIGDRLRSRTYGDRAGPGRSQDPATKFEAHSNPLPPRVRKRRPQAPPAHNTCLPGTKHGRPISIFSLNAQSLMIVRRTGLRSY